MTPSRETVDASAAPPAVGPYSHAVKTGELLYCSGQLPLDPSTGNLVGQQPSAQAEQCLRNIEAVCSAAGTALERAVRLTVYLSDLAAFDEVNAVYARFFEAAPPARTAVQAAALPRGAQVEIDAVVVL
jgi:2-iminobutanoate/2-iminopropanoate deaminase